MLKTEDISYVVVIPYCKDDQRTGVSWTGTYINPLFLVAMHSNNILVKLMLLMIDSNSIVRLGR